MRVLNQQILWMTLFLLAGTASHAATVSLVPISATQGLAGDRVTLEIVLDFSEEGGVLGGGFDINFNSSSLSLVSAIDYGSTFFHLEPDIQDGFIESWGIGGLGAIATEPMAIGTVEFEILSGLPLDSGTFVTIGATQGIAGPWQSPFDFLTTYDPTYNQIEVTRVPATYGSVAIALEFRSAATLQPRKQNELNTDLNYRLLDARPDNPIPDVRLIQ